MAERKLHALNEEGKPARLFKAYGSWHPVDDRATEEYGDEDITLGFCGAATEEKDFRDGAEEPIFCGECRKAAPYKGHRVEVVGKPRRKRKPKEYPPPPMLDCGQVWRCGQRHVRIISCDPKGEGRVLIESVKRSANNGFWISGRTFWIDASNFSNRYPGYVLVED